MRIQPSDGMLIAADRRRICGQPTGSLRRLVNHIFGDGKKLIEISPVMFLAELLRRSDRLIAVGQRDHVSPKLPSEWLDEVLNQIEDEHR